MIPHYHTLYQLDAVADNGNLYGLSPSVPTSVFGMLYYPYIAVFSEETALTLTFRGQRHSLNVGDILVLPGAVLPDAPVCRGVHYIYLSSSHLNLSSPQRFLFQNPAEARRCVRRMHEMYRKGSAASYYAAVSDFYRLLSMIAEDERNRTGYGGLFFAIQYIRSHYAEKDFRLSDLAPALGIGESSFRSRFTALFGMTPRAYVAGLRLSAFDRLLQSGATPQEAAAAAGFSSLSHLSDTHRRLRGEPFSALTKAEAKRRSAAAQAAWEREAEAIAHRVTDEIFP